jgi:hypothetical protein
LVTGHSCIEKPHSKRSENEETVGNGDLIVLNFAVAMARVNMQSSVETTSHQRANDQYTLNYVGFAPEVNSGILCDIHRAVAVPVL